jgi:hypothetical protein
MNEPFSYSPYPMNPLQDQRVMRFRKVGGIGTTAIVLILLVAILSVIGVASVGSDASDTVPDRQDGELGVAILCLLGYLLCGIFFWIWQFRARDNAESMAGRQSQRRQRGWAFWGWWCPVVSLWFPSQVLADIDRVSPPRRYAVLVGCWWPPMLASMILFDAVVVTTIGDDFPTAAHTHTEGVLLVAAVACEVVAAVLVVTIIGRINRWQWRSQVTGRTGTVDPFSW